MERETKETKETKEKKGKKEKKEKEPEIREESKEDRESRKFKEALNNYYKLKDAYENENKKDKTKIVNMPDLSWKEKRAEFQKLKNKCINCKRPVGTIFGTQLVEDDRHLIAMCGDRREPCPLNININLAIINSIENELNYDEHELSKYKKQIILDKNDLLFGYITPEEAVERFDKIKDNVEHSTKMQAFLLQEHEKKINNEDRISQIITLKEEFYRYLETYNAMIEEYNTTQQVNLVRDAVQLLVNNIQPRAVEIRNKMYSYNGVEYNENEKITTLMQIPITKEDLEWNLSIKEPNVVAFVQGLDGFKKKKVSKDPTIATPAIPDMNKKEKKEKKEKKTKTLKKTKFIIENDSDEQKGGYGDGDDDDDYSIKEEFAPPKLSFNLHENKTHLFEFDPDERKGGFSGEDDDEDEYDDEPLDPIVISDERVENISFDSLDSI
jgi:hypothetical protein